MAKQPAALARYWKTHRKGGKSRKTRTVVVHKTRTVTRRAKPHRRRRSGGGGGMPKLWQVAAAAAGLAYVTGDQTGVKFIRDNAAKIPGAKTFGTAAALGGACLAVDRFIKPNKWLKLAGVAGVVLAAVKFGSQGTSFKWLGDDESSGDYDISDIEDLDDVGDDDMGDDDE